MNQPKCFFCCDDRGNQHSPPKSAELCDACRRQLDFLSEYLEAMRSKVIVWRS